jgi:hypothetical protein
MDSDPDRPERWPMRVTDLVATVADLDRMLKARYPRDEEQQTLAMIYILQCGMEALRKMWAEQHAKEHGCGVSYERIPYSALFDGKVE